MKEKEKAKYAFLGMDLRAGLKNARQLTRLKVIYPEIVSGEKELRRRIRENAIALLKSVDAPLYRMKKAREINMEDLDGLLEEALMMRGMRGRIEPSKLWRKLRAKTNTKLEEVT